ncbi:hypothetical protein Agub_g4515 [Astrephomene gubernaculifera]|uniref:CN hydrolase domain-containing protein n=1 Tax=Astrephomene gubernaculifera TaxID=47775 RepID=A0AAD3DLL7_9CHLO|nr:hypothetical protein Agub_g4515 [Astrephomene gubernaculifera]
MRSVLLFSGPRLGVTLTLLILTWATSAFGNSLQPISILVWLHPIILLLAYERAVQSFQSSILAHASIIIVQALGTTVAMAGALSYPTTTPLSLLATFTLGLFLAAATTFGALLPSFQLLRLTARLLPPSNPTSPSSLPLLGRILLVLPLYGFPILQTAVTSLTGLLLSHIYDPGVAISDWPALAQLTSLFGLWLLNFLPALTASAAHLLLTSEPLPLEPQPTQSSQLTQPTQTQPTQAQSTTWSRLNRPLRRHITAVPALFVLLTAIGGGLVYDGSYYQRPVAAAVASEQRLAASCVVNEGARPGSEDYLWIWKVTAERVVAGDHFVLWAEEAVALEGEEQEAALLEAGRDLLRTHGSPGAGTYLGLTYQKYLTSNATSRNLNSNSGSSVNNRLPRNKAGQRAPRQQGYVSGEGGGGGGGSSSNHFVLLGPDGVVVWDYLKAFPVPLVEAGVVAGPAHLPVADSPYGRLGGAICFDMDQPQYVRQAGAAAVQLMLQPSWTWGAVGPRHVASNALRAVENGFTLLRLHACTHAAAAATASAASSPPAACPTT